MFFSYNTRYVKFYSRGACCQTVDLVLVCLILRENINDIYDHCKKCVTSSFLEFSLKMCVKTPPVLFV